LIEKIKKVTRELIYKLYKLDLQIVLKPTHELEEYYEDPDKQMIAKYKEEMQTRNFDTHIGIILCLSNMNTDIRNFDLKKKDDNIKRYEKIKTIKNVYSQICTMEMSD